MLRCKGGSKKFRIRSVCSGGNCNSTQIFAASSRERALTISLQVSATGLAPLPPNSERLMNFEVLGHSPILGSLSC